MADITKCKGTSCTLKDNCYRFTAQANEWRQSYFMKVPVTFQSGVQDCDEYWPNKTKAEMMKEATK